MSALPTATIVPMRFHAFGLVAAICCLPALAGAADFPQAGGGNAIALIPLPRSLKTEPGFLSITADSRVVAASPELAPLAAILSDEIRRASGIRLETAGGNARPGDVLLSFDRALKGEAYTLDVAANATVKGASYDAVASGTATLLQALRSSDGKRLILPCLHISDEPAFAFRGALLDLARKYHSTGGIKQVIELCRVYKVRYLHVHISDDQLFMFPSTAFPQVGKGNREFARFEPGSKPHVDPYTLAELKDLEQFSKERGVHIVPELDLPGHSGRLVGDAPEIFAFPGNGSTINIANPRTLAAVKTLLNEVMDVFQSTPYVHLGADEVGLGGLESTPEYKDAVAKYPSIKSPHDLYCKFIVDLHDIVAQRGKKAIVWEEACNADGAYPLPKDTLVMVWSQGRNPNDIAKSGYSIANATWTPLYIVRDNKKPLEFLFDWELAKFGREGSNEYTTLKDTERLAGVQLCSWEDSESIEIQSLRGRLALVAERAWNPQAGGMFAEFTSRLAHTDAVLERLVNPVTIHVEGQLVRDENTFAEPITITLSPQAFVDHEGLVTRYTLDNSLPNAGWKTYTAPISLEQTAHLRAGLFDGRGVQHGYLVGSWFRRIVVVKPNLATHKPVTVGPSPDRDDAWSAKVAVDGRADEANGHWASVGAAPQWLQIDLEKVHPVDFINVITYWDGSRYYQLTAEISEDGKTWKRVLDFSGNKAFATAAGYSGKFTATSARYVRINMLKNSANPFVHIVEVVVDEAK
jgi:hexosaminidase